MFGRELPIPDFYDRGKADQIRKTDYQEIAKAASEWAHKHELQNPNKDSPRICLLLVDCQNTFCTPGFELFVAGKSGNGAVEDSKRISEFIYKNIPSITKIVASMDTHRAMQVFHPVFLIDSDSNHPEPFTMVSLEDIENGKWKVNPSIAENIEGKDYESLQKYLEHYVRGLKESGKMDLMIWPYHSMLGGIGHALVPHIEEAVFFHNMARQRQAGFEIKGENPLTENYSIFRPEVTEDERDQKIASENEGFFDRLLSFDKVIIAGQAKSHCVAWTVEDLLSEIKSRNPKLSGRIYLMEDCTSPVVMPDGPDFSEQADRAFERFAQEGMHLVKSTDSISSWPDIQN